MLMEVSSVITGPKVHSKSSRELSEQTKSRVYVLIAISLQRVGIRG
jgi:hypothetical protein